MLSIGIAALAAAPLKFQQEIVNLISTGSFAISQLLLLGTGMSGVILASLGLKWLMGYLSQLLGEDVIRRIRNGLVSDAVMDPASQGARHRGALSTAISAEAEDLGKFAGSAFSEPVMQVGTLISVVGFVAATQPGLGVIAFSMILPQIMIVLFTQRKVNAFLAERVRMLRHSTDMIASADLQSISQEVTEEFDRIYETRRKMFRWKLSTKFVLSAINGGGTVLVLVLGGWFVAQGKTDVGTVVAATIGLDRLRDPTMYLISFYRQVSANRVKFQLLRDMLVHRVESDVG
ncbi:ABC transporter transmembrane domain-containing protein [Ovoidimarina sediminis]|uniref:ABC transporter transmembrane domain-containing protein n=1 Tax=Ovoidimarina sediminis TaxID=3079856 RepID=UPI00292D7433|nr:ABC transporter transmembrane domain-containing protein [Rhodophyticola sp. MJ-SS7]